LGFHADPQGGVHTVARGFEYLLSYVNQLNVFVFLWPIPGLLVLALALGAAGRLVSRWELALLGLLTLQLLVYAAYWAPGQFLGPRFLFPAIPAVVILVAGAPFALRARGAKPPAAALALTVMLAVLVAWLPIPNVLSVHGMAQRVRDAREEFKVDIPAALAQAGITRGLVWIREPFADRLRRRLWAAGLSRTEAVMMARNTDACALNDALRAIERDSAIGGGSAAVLANVARDARLTERSIPLRGGALRVRSEGSMTPSCQAEVEGDLRLPIAAYGPVLRLMPIGEGGRISGDLVYAADLGELNDRLRARFADRPWYRLRLVRDDAGIRAAFDPYE
jgi:hypothetical protein